MSSKKGCLSTDPLILSFTRVFIQENISYALANEMVWKEQQKQQSFYYILTLHAWNLPLFIYVVSIQIHVYRTGEV